jgi:hypothetical protein
VEKSWYSIYPVSGPDSWKAMIHMLIVGLAADELVDNRLKSLAPILLLLFFVCV